MIDRTPRQPRERGAFSGGLAVFAIALLVGGGIGMAVRRTQPPRIGGLDLAATATTVENVDTTVPGSTLELPTTVEVTTTVVPETIPETTPPVTEPALVADLALDPDGSVVKVPGSADRRLVDTTLGCDGFTASAAPGSASSCGDVAFGSSDTKWLTSVEGTLEILQLNQSVDGGDVWDVVLSGPDSGRSIDPFTSDLNGDGSPDLIMSWKEGETLRIDVASATSADSGARVLFHVDLPNGRARVDSALLNVWFDAGVPDMFTHAVIERSNGRWTARPLDQVSVGSVGASEL